MAACGFYPLVKSTAVLWELEMNHPNFDYKYCRNITSTMPVLQLGCFVSCLIANIIVIHGNTVEDGQSLANERYLGDLPLYTPPCGRNLRSPLICLSILLDVLIY